MWLHNMFYPSYKSIADYSVFEKFMFLSIPVDKEILSKKEETSIPMPITKKKEILPITKKEEIPMQIPITIPKTEKTEEPITITIQSRLEKECLIAKNVQDGLFWSMYIAHNGYNEYNRNKYNYGKIEVQEKEKIAQHLHNNSKQKQTNYKLTRGFCCEIESDLITKPKISFSGLIGMCAMYTCNIVVVDLTKNIYYLFESSDQGQEGKNPTYILYKNPLYTGKRHKSNEYFVDVDHKIYSWLELKDRFFKIENYLKPMKSITTYKKIELECISEKLNLTGDGKEDKHQLYERILLYISNENENE